MEADFTSASPMTPEVRDDTRRETVVSSAPHSSPSRPGAFTPPLFGGATRALFNRITGWMGLVGLVLGAFVLKSTGMGFSVCTLQRMTGLPCPGCGLTRSVTSFYHGHWIWSVNYHPLGWVFAVYFAISTVLLLLPRNARERAINAIERHDRIVGWLTIAAITGMIVYGFVRIYFVVSGNPDYSWWRQDGALPPFIKN